MCSVLLCRRLLARCSADSRHGGRRHRIRHAHADLEQTMRTLMRQIAQPVAIVTTASDASGSAAQVHDYGATISSFTSLSLNPLIVGFSFQRPSRISTLLAHVEDGQKRRANIYLLSSEQSHIAKAFARFGLEPGEVAVFPPDLFEDLRRGAVGVLQGHVGETFRSDEWPQHRAFTPAGPDARDPTEVGPRSDFHLLQVDIAHYQTAKHPLLWFQRDFYTVGDRV